MAMTVLQLVQSLARRQGIPQPTFVAGSTNAQDAQLLGLLEEFVDDLVTRGWWSTTTREATFVTTASEDQGLMTTLAPFGYRGLVPETFFDHTQRLTVPIAITPQEWQMRKTLGFTGPLYQARLRGGHLLFIPAPPVDHTMAFEYYSDFFVTDSTGVGKSYPTADNDTFNLPDALPIAWLRWRWKAQKGLDYAEEFRAYEAMVNVQQVRDNAPQRVNMADQYQDAKPGIVVPPGSWPLSNP